MATKIKWRVEILVREKYKPTRTTRKTFDSLKVAKDFLRQYVRGDIYEIRGRRKRLAYFLSNNRIYSA